MLLYIVSKFYKKRGGPRVPPFEVLRPLDCLPSGWKTRYLRTARTQVSSPTTWDTSLMSPTFIILR